MSVDNGRKLVYFCNGHCNSDVCFISGLSLRMLQEIIEVRTTFLDVETAHLESFTITLWSCIYVCVNRRDELLGLSGIVKITNPDSLQNHNGPVAISITRTPSDDNVPLSSVPSSNTSTKRFIHCFPSSYRYCYVVI